MQARRFGLGLTVLALGLAGCGGGQPAAPRTDTVARATISRSVGSNGSLAAGGTENLGFPKGGKLTSVKVKVGDRVLAGDVLASVDNAALKRIVDQQEANLAAQDAALGRLINSTSVSGAGSTLDQSKNILAATKAQVTAVQRADAVAITRARKQVHADKEAEEHADDALSAARRACRRSQGTAPASDTLTALAQLALQQLGAGDAAAASATLATLSAQLNAAAAAGTGSSACAQVATTHSAEDAADSRVVASKTALAAAEQKKKVDAAAGRLSVETTRQSVVAAQNGFNAADSDQPFTVQSQRALVTAAEASLKSARQDVADTVLRAPADGTVSALNGRVGEYVSPSSGTSALAPGSNAAIPGVDSGSGSSGGAGASGGASTTRPGGAQFLVLSDIDKLEVVLPFEESDAAQLKAGQKVALAFDAVPDLTEPGRVRSIAPTGANISGVISYYATVRVDGTDDRLKAGQTVRATVTTAERQNVLSVSNKAVRLQGDASTVVVSDGSTQRAVAFEAGLVGPERTEVVSGLTEGQQIVLPTGS